MVKKYDGLVDDLNLALVESGENAVVDSEMVLFEDLLSEFKGDTKKQLVVMMGLPAAGKSTFIKTGGINKYIPGFKGYKVTNSDTQLARIQHDAALIDFKRLSRVKDDAEWTKVLKQAEITDNDGRKRQIPFTWDEFRRIKNFGEYYKLAYKPYYSVYFDLRDIASKFDKELFNDKIVKAGNILVIDTVAAKPDKIFKRLAAAKKEGFQNNIFYLEVDPKLCVARDAYRGETEGRTVGKKVIFDYAKKMDSAFRAYISSCGKSDGLVDRLYHFKWHPSGDSPIKGSWSLEKESKCDVARSLASLRDKTMAQDS
jgi:predicted kinase